MSSNERTGVLFVCMGNICRSPLAEGIFLHEINRRGVAERFAVDSCGTGHWHAGDRPDPRSINVAARYGVTLPGHARQVRRDDFERFAHLVCMDRSVAHRLRDLGAPEERLRLLLSRDPDEPHRDVPDPYTWEPEQFDQVYTLIAEGVETLLQELLEPTS